MGLFGGGLSRSELAEFEALLPGMQQDFERAKLRLWKFFPEGQERAAEFAAVEWAACFTHLEMVKRAIAGHKPTIASLKEALKMVDAQGRR